MHIEPTTSRRQLLKGAVGGAVALTGAGWLAACSSDDGTSSPTTGAGAAPSPTTAAGEPRQGGTLRVGMLGGGATDTLDPNFLVSIPDYARSYLLYSGIVGRDNDFQLQLQLAEELVPDATGQVWDLRVRQGVEFHNGVIAAASFLGLGVQAPEADWGLMINENRDGLVTQPWGVLGPVLLIALFTIGSNLVADGIGRAVAGDELRGGGR